MSEAVPATLPRRPVAFTVNGRRVSAEVEPRTHLADFLRDELRLSGTHLGCEHGVCGACTVLIDGAPARSCITYAAACEGLEIRTIEGFEDDATMARLREAFARDHGLQCGFCTPGMLIAARDIVERLPGADERRVRVELSGNLCRCTGYQGIVNAVCNTLAERREGTPVAVPAAAAPAAPAKFAPMASAPVAPPAAAQAPETAVSRAGWTRFSESFVVAAPPATVWQAFEDLPGIAACLPGAELQEHDATSVKGGMRVKLGPIAARFAGSAAIERDAAALAGRIKGGGSDSGSGSRTRGEVAYRLSPTADGAATRVEVVVEYSLQGPLAQFSRSGLAQELGRRLVAEFAANLNARLTPSATGAPPAPAPMAQLNAWTLVWSALRHWLGGLFGARGR